MNNFFVVDTHKFLGVLYDIKESLSEECNGEMVYKRLDYVLHHFLQQGEDIINAKQRLHGLSAAMVTVARLYGTFGMNQFADQLARFIFSEISSLLLGADLRDCDADDFVMEYLKETVESSGKLAGHWSLGMQLFGSLIDLRSCRWNHPVLRAILDGDEVSQEQVLEYIDNGEPEELVRLRIKFMLECGCDEEACNYIGWCLRGDRYKDDVELTVKHLDLLCKLRRLDEFSKQCRGLNCCAALDCVRYAHKAANAVSSNTVYLMAKEFMGNECHQFTEPICAKVLLKEWLKIEAEMKANSDLPGFLADLEEMIHLCIDGRQLVDFLLALESQFGRTYVAPCLDAGLRALRKERYRLHCEMNYSCNQAEIESATNNIISVLECLARLFNDHLQLKLSCLLSAFSLSPSVERMKALRPVCEGLQAWPPLDPVIPSCVTDPASVADYGNLLDAISYLRRCDRYRPSPPGWDSLKRDLQVRLKEYQQEASQRNPSMHKSKFRHIFKQSPSRPRQQQQQPSKEPSSSSGPKPKKSNVVDACEPLQDKTEITAPSVANEPGYEIDFTVVKRKRGRPPKIRRNLTDGSALKLVEVPTADSSPRQSAGDASETETAARRKKPARAGLECGDSDTRSSYGKKARKQCRGSSPCKDKVKAGKGRCVKVIEMDANEPSSGTDSYCNSSSVEDATVEEASSATDDYLCRTASDPCSNEIGKTEEHVEASTDGICETKATDDVCKKSFTRGAAASTPPRCDTVTECNVHLLTLVTPPEIVDEEEVQLSYVRPSSEATDAGRSVRSVTVTDCFSPSASSEEIAKADKSRRQCARDCGQSEKRRKRSAKTDVTDGGCVQQTDTNPEKTGTKRATNLRGKRDKFVPKIGEKNSEVDVVSDGAVAIPQASTTVSKSEADVSGVNFSKAPTAAAFESSAVDLVSETPCTTWIKEPGNVFENFSLKMLDCGKCEEKPDCKPLPRCTIGSSGQKSPHSICSRRIKNLRAFKLKFLSRAAENKQSILKDGLLTTTAADVPVIASDVVKADDVKSVPAGNIVDESGDRPVSAAGSSSILTARSFALTGAVRGMHGASRFWSPSVRLARLRELAVAGGHKTKAQRNCSVRLRRLRSCDVENLARCHVVLQRLLPSSGKSPSTRLGARRRPRLPSANVVSDLVKDSLAMQRSTDGGGCAEVPRSRSLPLSGRDSRESSDVDCVWLTDSTEKSADDEIRCASCDVSSADESPSTIIHEFSGGGVAATTQASSDSDATVLSRPDDAKQQFVSESLDCRNCVAPEDANSRCAPPPENVDDTLTQHDDYGMTSGGDAAMMQVDGSCAVLEPEPLNCYDDGMYFQGDYFVSEGNGCVWHVRPNEVPIEHEMNEIEVSTTTFVGDVISSELDSYRQWDRGVASDRQPEELEMTSFARRSKSFIRKCGVVCVEYAAENDEQVLDVELIDRQMCEVRFSRLPDQLMKCTLLTVGVDSIDISSSESSDAYSPRNLTEQQRNSCSVQQDASPSAPCVELEATEIEFHEQLDGEQSTVLVDQQRAAIAPTDCTLTSSANNNAPSACPVDESNELPDNRRNDNAPAAAAGGINEMKCLQDAERPPNVETPSSVVEKTSPVENKLDEEPNVQLDVPDSAAVGRRQSTSTGDKSPAKKSPVVKCIVCNFPCVNVHVYATHMRLQHKTEEVRKTSAGTVVAAAASSTELRSQRRPETVASEPPRQPNSEDVVIRQSSRFGALAKKTTSTPRVRKNLVFH